MKHVIKPWGYEEWLELNSFYCMKILFVSAGERLSVQYHERKTETLYVVSGQCVIKVDGDEVAYNESGWITIRPGQVHNIVAITDTKILEASSPEVEDVVRLEDKYGRVE